MKLRIRRKINECDGMNTTMNTMGIGNPIIGSPEGTIGSGDLWTSVDTKKKKSYKIRKKSRK